MQSRSQQICKIIGLNEKVPRFKFVSLAQPYTHVAYVYHLCILSVCPSTHSLVGINQRYLTKVFSSTKFNKTLGKNKMNHLNWGKNSCIKSMKKNILEKRLKCGCVTCVCVCEGQMNISSANALVMLLFSECCKVQTCRVLVQWGLAREQRAALSTLDVVWCGGAG